MSIFVLSLLAGCDNNIQGNAGAGVGESCTEDRCGAGLVCGHEGVCVAPGALGSVEESGDCSATEECAFELVCSADNLCAPAGAAGTGSEGDGCLSDEECQAGHFCGDDGQCVDIGIPYWAGGACPADDEEGEFRVLFDAPDLPAAGELDFFAMPFPNDARLDVTGKPDLSGFPDPGGETAVAALVGSIEDGWAGWGTNPTVYFRFSRAQNTGTVRADGADASIRFVSLDEDAEDYGDLTSLQYATRVSRGKYICQNWVAVSVYDGRPLEEGHTYAVWLTKDITDLEGNSVVRDNGMKVALQEERPSNLGLGLAWDAYQPLRDYIAREGVDASRIAGAAVFTTGYPTKGTRYFREVTEASELEVAASDLVLCEEGVVSPCDDGVERICGSAQPGFAEVHGRLNVPRYAVDGDVAYDPATLRPLIQDGEEVCFAMTIPTGEAPADGWPVAVLAPDVGGTFRDGVANGVAEALALEGVATFSLELPGHGERGSVYIDPWDLDAWRGRQLQAAADPHAAIRFLDAFTLDALDSVTGSSINFDSTNFWFVGLGEGASVGANFLAWSLDVRGAVLGNPYGRDIYRFADEDTPVDVEHVLMSAFADSALTRWHPMVTLLGQYFESVDPVNNAYAVVRDSGTTSKHLLVFHGVEDTQTPAGSLQSMLRALYIPTAGTVLEDYGQSETTLPVFENVSTDDGRRTAATVQMDGGRDAMLEPDAINRGAAFIASGLGGVSPTIE